MSSSNKTTNLKLNQWSGSDIPERLDFVNDNAIIDREFSNHAKNIGIHITNDEREAWDHFYYRTSYIGDGSSPRTVVTRCPFDASWGVVYASSYPPSVVDVPNDSNYNYFGIFNDQGNMAGVSLLADNNIKVYQSSTAVQKTEYRNYNQNGVLYQVIMFR